MLTEKISQIESLKEQLDAIRVGAKGEAVPQLPKKESVELPPIVVRPAPKEEPAIEEPAVALEGKILAINKDNNFVIIDFGSDAGAKVGDAFQVYRDGKAIANIEVIQARRNISACDIKRESASIKIGDIVK
jgi:hypothetical protein